MSRPTNFGPPRDPSRQTRLGSWVTGIVRVGLRRLLPPGDAGLSLIGDLLQEHAARVAGSSWRANLWLLWAALQVSVFYAPGAARRRADAERNFAGRGSRGRQGGIVVFFDDLLLAVRLLRKRPLFLTMTVLTLAVGIGANTAVFTAVNTLFLRPLPGIAEPQGMVELGRTDDGAGFDSFNYADLMDFAELDVFSGLSVIEFGDLSWSGEDGGHRVMSYYVSANYFDILGVDPILGRRFLPEEDHGVGQHPVAIVSQRFWRDKLSGDSGVVGSTILLNRQPYTVVGVAPKAFRGHMVGFAPEVWLPMMQAPEFVKQPELLTSRRFVSFSAIARLAAGVGVGEARIAAQTVAARLAKDFPASHTGRSVELIRLGPVPGFGRPFVAGFATVLQIAVGLLLVLTCANVGGLLTAKSLAREKEIAVRLALGCRRRRLVSLLLVESLVLGVLGGLAGSAVAIWALRSIDLGALPLPMTLELDLSPDLRVLLASLAATILATVFFGLVPALQATRPQLISALHEASSGPGSRRFGLRGVLIAVQIAATVILVAVGSLFLRSLQHAGRIETGFDARGVVMTSLDLGLEGYDEVRALGFLDDVLSRVAVLPGVEATAFSSDLPLDMNERGTSILPEGAESGDENARVGVAFNEVSADYFQALGIRLLAGRAFTAADRAGAPPVVVVSTDLADKLYPGQSPLGKRFDLEVEGMGDVVIVGLVGNVKNQMLMDEAKPFVYAPLAQSYSPRLYLTTRSSGDPSSLHEPLRRALRDVDPDLSLTAILGLTEFNEIGVLPQQVAAAVSVSLGSVGILLSVLGLYGVMAYAVLQRRREIGVRMALGADRLAVLRQVVGRAFVVALPGLLLGGAVAIGASRLLRGMMLGIEPLDPASLGVVAGASALIVLVAAWVPARRASRVHPADALRPE